MTVAKVVSSNASIQQIQRVELCKDMPPVIISLFLG